VEYQTIVPYIEKGLISEQVHPENPSVRIFNYTQACQFTQAWDDVTLQCRGLIMHVDTGEIIARPFPKFFNYGEHVSKGWAIPSSKPVVTEKLDGSLGILYKLNGVPRIATRGSFTSDQALWATEWWQTNVEQPDIFEPGLTNLFEIIYPANRIVVSYDFSGLVHLATLDNETGRPAEVNWSEPVRTAKQISFTDLETLSKVDEPNSEGFVLYYPDDNVRMKIKFSEYVRLHKLVTGVNEIAIWEYLRDGKSLADLIDKVPDEFYQWVTQTSNRLNKAFNEIRDQAERDFSETLEWARDAGFTEEGYDRKEIALYFQKKQNPGILFAMLDNKPTAPLIWRMVRPHGGSAFKNDIDV
jgi:RNA ligase